MYDRYRAFIAGPTVPLCQVVHEYRLFNLYGERLGVQAGTLVIPDLGGSALVSRYQLVDSAGLTDAVIARALRAGDGAAIHNYVLDTVRPEFIHKHGPYLPAIADDPRFQAAYTEIVAGRDYVRRDLMQGREQVLATLRSQADGMLRDVQSFVREHPRSSCGDRLEPGSLPQEP